MSSPYPNPYSRSPIINKYKQHKVSSTNATNTITLSTSSNNNVTTKALCNLKDLSLKSKTLSILTTHGFHSTAQEVLQEANSSIGDLACELECSIFDTLEIMNELKRSMGMIIVDSSNSATSDSVGTVATTTPMISSNTNNDYTVASLLFQHTPPRSIITCCKAIDELLCGGIATGEVTEVVGKPGVGKTQLCMQVCVDARIPTIFGGVSGEAVYIDTEGSFSPERCYCMSLALVHYVVQKKRKRQEGASTVSSQWYTVEDIMKGIHIFRVHDESQLVATIKHLPKFLKEREKLGLSVKVVVIDSVAFHYRYTTENNDMRTRTGSLVSLASQLHNIAITSSLAVLVTNQMTTNTKMSQQQNGNNFNSSNHQQQHQCVPALGESWAHTTSTRIVLSNYGDNTNPSMKHTSSLLNGSNGGSNVRRVCSLMKSLHTSPGVAYFTILDDGIRDIA